MRHPDSFEHDGKTYDLLHLQPTQFSLTLQAHKDNPELVILVDLRYSNHCYTEGATDVGGREHDMLDHNDWPRWFCPGRHDTSLLLPDLVQELHKKKCLFTGKHNWLVVEIQTREGERVPFHVYFAIRKNKHLDNGLFVTIESAYLKTRGENSPHRHGGMDRTAFALLARKTLSGQGIKRPRR